MSLEETKEDLLKLIKDKEYKEIDEFIKNCDVEGIDRVYQEIILNEAIGKGDYKLLKVFAKNYDKVGFGFDNLYNNISDDWFFEEGRITPKILKLLLTHEKVKDDVRLSYILRYILTRVDLIDVIFSEEEIIEEILNDYDDDGLRNQLFDGLNSAHIRGNKEVFSHLSKKLLERM